MLTVLLIMLAGCEQLEIGNDDERREGADFANAPRIESTALETSIKVDIRGADPEKYAVHFTWPYLKDNKILRIRLGSVLAEVQPKQAYFNYVLDHSQTATFSFDVLDSSRKQERSFRVPVVIPTDFVVRPQNANLSEQSRIEVNRLFLNEQVPLTTMGKNVDIVVTELHGGKGKGQIQSFSDNPPEAPPLTEGQSGGNLTISAKKLFGRITVVMRGGRGGQGPKGDPTPGKGATGARSTEGPWICDNTPIGDPGNPTPSPGGRCECTAGPPGGIGGQGGPGSKGKNGMPGGLSGSVRVSVQEYVPLEGFDPTLPQENTEIVSIKLIPGPGGRGGPGGDGQDGGDGGPGSTRSDDCLGGWGPKGPVGPPGKEGDAGDSGKIGLKCLYIGSENINECIQ